MAVIGCRTYDAIFQYLNLTGLNAWCSEGHIQPLSHFFSFLALLVCSACFSVCGGVAAVSRVIGCGLCLLSFSGNYNPSSLICICGNFYNAARQHTNSQSLSSESVSWWVQNIQASTCWAVLTYVIIQFHRAVNILLIYQAGPILACCIFLYKSKLTNKWFIPRKDFMQCSVYNCTMM